MAKPKPYLRPAMQEAFELFKKAAMMAHPADPWPYGTVLRRSDAPHSALRAMWLGNNLIQPIAGFGGDVTELRETRPGLWEPVEDTTK
jgi:hypothetical protein